MMSIDEVLDSFKQATLPLLNDLKGFLVPFAAVLPDRRYGDSVLQFVLGMLAARSPQVVQAADQERVLVMARACGPDVKLARNPGAFLGVAMGEL
jgi:hypothetical protein